jgi:hypothetical protein
MHSSLDAHLYEINYIFNKNTNIFKLLQLWRNMFWQFLDKFEIKITSDNQITLYKIMFDYKIVIYGTRV